MTRRLKNLPIFRMKEIRTMSRPEREEKIVELRAELVRLRTTVEAGGAVENPAKIGEIHKTIARILTVLTEENQA